jgi:hypothetical protein
MASIDKRPNGGYRARWREYPGGPQRTRHFARKAPCAFSTAFGDVNGGPILTQRRRLKVDPRPVGGGHVASSVGTLPRSLSLSR